MNLKKENTKYGDSSLQALIKYFSSWQQASQTKNFLPIFLNKFEFWL
jgi:hypothetical protein